MKWKGKTNNTTYTALLDNIQDGRKNSQTTLFKTLMIEEGKSNFIKEANLLYYRFTKLGDYLGETRICPKSEKVFCQKNFSQFQSIVFFQCKN